MNKTKSGILPAFNKQMEEFVNDIVCVFPDDNDIKKAERALSVLRKLNPKLCITVWRECILKPYHDQIFNNDIEFFVSKDYKMDVEGGDYECILGPIERLRKPVSEMGEENQNKVLKYIQNLSKLSELYQN